MFTALFSSIVFHAVLYYNHFITIERKVVHMGLFSKWFKRDTAGRKAPDTGFENPECQKLWDLGSYMKVMLEETRYIAKKDYQNHLLEEKKIIEYFDVLQRSGLFAFYGAQRSPFCFRTAAFRSQRPPIF